MMVSYIFGGAKLRFGGARLPNDLEMTNRANGLCNQIVRVRRLARRAVGTSVVRLLDLNLLRRLGTWCTTGQRLGGSVNSDQTEGPHLLWALLKWLGRSEASPTNLAEMLDRT